MVDAGYFDKVERDPEWEISLAAMLSPINSVRFGATIYILPFKYYWIYLRNSNILIVLSHKSWRHWISN